MTTLLKNKRAIFAWCLFDWANSPFSAIVATFIFPTYFTEKIAVNDTIGTAQWGSALAIASLIIAFAGPITGAIADNTKRRKPWLATFSLVTILSSGLLWFALPSHHSAFFTLLNVSIALIGFELGMIFYNAMLPDIAPDSYTGRVSGWGWGLGYLGGLTCLSMVFYLFVLPVKPLFGLDKISYQHVRICGPVISLWFIVFALPLFLFTPDKTGPHLTMMTAVKRGLTELKTTILRLPSIPYLIRYLVARMIYTDGINTIFFFGGIYAAGTFHFSVIELVEFGIAMNLTAGLGAICFAWLDDWYGSKFTILLSLSFLALCLIDILLIQTQYWFWIISVLSGLFYGPIQAASRTLLTRLAPKEYMTEMFGIYSLSGKATAFLGPWLVGSVTLYFHSQRLGLATVLVFLVVGGYLLIGVREPLRSSS